MARKHANSTTDPSRNYTAIYMRVSSTSQQLAAQQPDLERWAAAQTDKVLWWTDRASGTTMSRPSWDYLWKDVLEGRVARIVVWRLDRLGRTASGLTSLFDELRARKVGLFSLRDGLDLETPAGRLMAGVLASVAQYETEVRSERQTAGIAQAKARGVRFGPKPGTGGRPTAVTAEKREVILRLKRERWRVSAIARTVGLSRTTVYGVLTAR